MTPADRAPWLWPLGDSAVLVDLGEPARVEELVRSLQQMISAGSRPETVATNHPRRRGETHRIDSGRNDAERIDWAGVEDIVPTLESLTVVVDPDRVQIPQLTEAIRQLPPLDRCGSYRAGFGADHRSDPGIDHRSGCGGDDLAAVKVSSSSGTPRSGGSAGSLESEPNPGDIETGVDEAPAVQIPVRFDGPDLLEVASLAGITASAVIAIMLNTVFTVGFVGFCPGFAYLLGLPEPLAGVPRRPTPRTRVPAGSLALAGGFTAVYPQSSPGGWHLVGTTTAVLFDPTTTPYALLTSGNRVRFVPAPSGGTRHSDHTGVFDRAGPGRSEPSHQPRPPRRTPDLPAAAIDSTSTVVVEESGPATTLQDAGRIGLARLGIPRAGAADELAQIVANRLVGNHDRSAVIETTGSGPRLRFSSAAVVAIVGDVTAMVDGSTIETGAPVAVARGQLLQVGRNRRGIRATVAVAGGWQFTTTFGSYSTDQLSGLGPGPLVTGDRLVIGEPSRPRGQLRMGIGPNHPLGEWADLTGLGQRASRMSGTAWPGMSGGGIVDNLWTIRFVAGPDADHATLRRLCDQIWTVLPDSNRVGVRLGPTVRCEPPPSPRPGIGPRQATSDTERHTADLPRAGSSPRGMVTGIVQLPPDGHPVILLCDHATVGGYPIAGTTASIDMSVVAQLRPGSRLRLTLVDVDGAARARRAGLGVLADAIVGWLPIPAERPASQV